LITGHSSTRRSFKRTTEPKADCSKYIHDASPEDLVMTGHFNYTSNVATKIPNATTIIKDSTAKLIKVNRGKKKLDTARRSRL
jgi:ketopantoate hydroxymethyltransferase